MTRMTPEDAQAWIDALESGKYKKGKFALCDRDDNMCCLGVLADMRDKLSKRRNSDGYRYIIGGGKNADLFAGGTAYSSRCEISISVQRVLAQINDRSDTFAPVIRTIREFYIDN